MAQFLSTKGSLFYIEEVIRTAKDELVLITPFVKLSDAFQRRLKEAAARGVETTLVCRYGELADEWRSFFASMSGCVVRDEPRLHAKCFHNEEAVVLTSLNLYDFSEGNHEMGVLLTPGDGEIFQRAIEEAASITQHAAEVEASGKRARSRGRAKSAGVNGAGAPAARPKASRGARNGEASGHCIRCGTGIDYDPGRPYCYPHYKEWAEWSDPTYGDDYCHSCGRKQRKGFSMEKPECPACYRKNVYVRS